MRTAKKPKAAKSDKVQLRLHHRQKSVIARAAEIKQTSFTNFMVEHAYEAAQQVMAEQTHFALSGEGWAAFCAALDAPPRDIPALRRLLNEPGLFDAPASTPRPSR